MLCPFCWLFNNPSDQTYFFKESSLYVFYLLIISLFLKFIFFYKYWKYVILPVVSLILWPRLGCKKKLAVFKWTNSNLDGVVLKNFWYQI